MANATALLLLGLSYHHQEQTRRSVHHSADVMNEMQQLRGAAIAARAQYDAYLKNPARLPAYRQSLQELSDEIDDAKLQTADNAGQQVRLKTFQSMMRFQPQAPRKLLFTNAERLQLLAITGEEVGLLLQRQDQAEKQTNLVYGLLLLCSVVSIAATTHALQASNLKNRALRQLSLKQTELSDRTVQLETLVRSIPGAVIIRNERGVCSEVLSEGNHLLLAPEGMVGKSIFDVAPFKVAAQIMGAIQQALETKQAISLSYEATLKDGRIIWFDATVSPIAADKVMVIATDATEEHRLHQQLIRQAVQDGLTGIYNFEAFRDIVRGEIALQQRRKQSYLFAFLLIDLDKFKAINDAHTHAGGNVILQKVAFCLQQHVRKGSTVARLGGDEFAVLLKDTNEQEATIAGERLRKAVERLEIPYNGKLIKVTVSLGIALYTPECTTFESIHRFASETLLQGKTQRRNQVYLAPCRYAIEA